MEDRVFTSNAQQRRYEKLRPTEETQGEGSFVRGMRGDDGSVGFAENQHVHKQWFKDCLPLDHVKELAQIAADCRRDLRVRAGMIGRCPSFQFARRFQELRSYRSCKAWRGVTCEM